MSSNESNGTDTPPFQTPPATPPNTPANGVHVSLSLSSSLEELVNINQQLTFSNEPDFKFYLLLPTELQIEICNMACEAREIVATEVPVHAMLLVNDNNGIPVHVPGFTSKITITGAQKPNIVLAFPGLATLFINTGVYKPVFVVHGSPKAVYFYPGKDILRIETNMAFVGLTPLCLLEKRLNNTADLQLVDQITIPVEDFLYCEPWVVSNISALRNLKQLNLVGTAYNTPRPMDGVGMIVVGYDVRTFYIGNTYPGGPIITQTLVDALFKVNGFVHQGIAAHQHAFMAMTDPLEQTYFLQIASQLNNMLGNGADLPFITVYMRHTI